MEILRQHHPQEHGPLRAIFVAIGGGGLISGVAAYVKAVRPEIKIIGVQTVDSDAMARSLAAGRRIALRDVGLFSDGTAVRQVGRETFRLCRRYVDDIVTVDNDAALRRDQGRLPGHALDPRAGRRAGRRRGQGLRSRETSLDGHRSRSRHLRRQHELRSAALRRRARRGRREARGGVRGDHPRAARQLQAPLRAGRRPQRHRVQLPHLRRARGARLRRRAAGARRARRAALPARVRDGRLPDARPDRRRARQEAPAPPGRRPLARWPHDEHLYRFEFPERPGALMRFLASMSPDWNISLFHYRNQGADYGARPGRPAGAAARARRAAPVPGRRSATAHWDESRQPGLPAVPALKPALKPARVVARLSRASPSSLP